MGKISSRNVFLLHWFIPSVDLQPDARPPPDQAPRGRLGRIRLLLRSHLLLRPTQLLVPRPTPRRHFISPHQQMKSELAKQAIHAGPARGGCRAREDGGKVRAEPAQGPPPARVFLRRPPRRSRLGFGHREGLHDG
ncbi:hypothetical protein BRADI_1g77295v3 [Brachypodium distachyon]|uniref:Uncharacterized protein n=1 Tax=Brachypodium distachyon TaxID=15368 RepID=A0A2K2DVL2_BRADI|nr:hypothetical protein BRADI_1g77295v3 [Brachypodium distachyon]